MPAGRPTLYNAEIAALICMRVATHTVGLARLCSMYDDMPAKITVNEWRSKHEEFAAQYALAKLKQADLLAEEILEIADDARGDIKVDEHGNEVCNTEFVARSRLRVDTRKWLASKLLPKQYGEAKSKEEDTTEDRLLDELKELRKQLAEKHKKEY